MGIFDRLRGKREDAAAEVSSAEAAAQVSPSLDLTEAAPSALPSTSQQPQFGKQTFGAAPSEQLYNPYEVRRRFRSFGVCRRKTLPGRSLGAVCSGWGRRRAPSRPGRPSATPPPPLPPAAVASEQGQLCVMHSAG